MTESSVTVEISIGELIDKITILELKSERIHEPDKLANVSRELSLLSECLDRYVPESPALSQLTKELKKVNTSLWEIEDAIRDCERKKQFDETFIRLARSVYQTNDRRMKLKREINQITGSLLKEEKSYASY